MTHGLSNHMKEFYNGKKVFVTGHTGFKGSWLTLWLEQLGATVFGYSNTPNNNGLLTERFQLQDVRDSIQLASALDACNPDVVFHLAAQSIVSVSYKFPRATFETNVMGTLNLLHALKQRSFSGHALIVTSDKVYRPTNVITRHDENDELGGNDPYSLSKACAELAVKAYRSCDNSFKITTLRAGNVIGGGDWSTDRLVPDCVNCFRDGQPILLRRPDASRPFQHVLDCLHGYLMAGAEGYEGALNFGPDESTCVSHLARLLVFWLGNPDCRIKFETSYFEETEHLDVDSSLAKSILGWFPVLSFNEAIQFTADWYLKDSLQESMREYSIGQIEKFCAKQNQFIESTWLSNLTP